MSKFIDLDQFTIFFPPQLDEEASTLFKDKMVNFLESPRHLFINCAALKEIPADWISSFRMIAEQLKMAGKNLILIFLRPKLIKEVNDPKRGFEFDISPSLSFALEMLDTSPINSASAHFLKAFVNATIKTVFVQCQTFCKKNKIINKTINPDELEGDVTGVINVSSHESPFLTMISFPEETLKALVERVLGEPVSDIQEAEDMATELMNIIYGQAKNILNQGGETNLAPEIPFLIRGRKFPEDPENEHQTKITTTLSKGYNIVVQFETEVGSFFIRNWFPFGFKVEMLK